MTRETYITYKHESKFPSGAMWEHVLPEWLAEEVKAEDGRSRYYMCTKQTNKQTKTHQRPHKQSFPMVQILKSKL